MRRSRLLLFISIAATFLAACQSKPRPVTTTSSGPTTTAPVAAPQPEPLPATIDEARALLANGHADEYERALKALTVSHDPATRRGAVALLGIYDYDQKRFDDALPLLTEAVSLYPEVAPFLRLRIAEIERGKGNLTAAIAATNAVMQETPASAAATIAKLRLPALYSEAGGTTSTDTAYAAAQSIAIDELTEPDFVDLATRLAKAGRHDLANAIRLRLLMQFPQGRFTEQTYGFLEQAAEAPLASLSFDESLAIATKLANNDRYDQALTMLTRIAQRFPQQSDASLYRTIRMRALFNSRRYTDLLDETSRIKLTDPSQLLTRARAAWRVGRGDEFLGTLDRIEREFPSSKEAIETKVLRAKYYTTDEVDYGRSLANLQKAIDAGSYGNEGENLWNLGWTYTLAQRYDEALATFAKYEKQFPDGDYLSNSLFWWGKIAARLGRTSERDAKFNQLLVQYPYSYFSYRARELMGVDPAAPATVDGGAIFPNLDAQLAAITEPRLSSVHELAWLGLMRDATREMKSVAAAYPDNLGVQFMLADLYVQGGEPFKANGVLQRRFRTFVRHGGSGIPRRFWEILFPLNYWPTIEAEAARRQVDPYLLASIIRQESGFEPTTVSNAGAVGIMQIMPAEAASIAGAAGLTVPTRQQLFDPQVNIAIGAAEYAQKLALMKGNPTLAVAAYNAGEAAVNRWTASTPIDDIDVFIESIPYAETRLYVKTVTRNRFEYRRIYGQSDAAPTR